MHLVWQNLCTICRIYTCAADMEDVKSRKFYVVQKIHCLKAFKDLDKSADFEQLPGHQNREVLCYILNCSSPEMMQYGNSRANYISGQFARKINPQDFLHYFNCLSMQDCTVKPLKVIERMWKQFRIGPDECTAMRKLCQWSTSGFIALMEVIDKFEKYETLDVKKKGHQQRLA